MTNLKEDKAVIVTGDVTMDWNLARTRRSRSDQSFWSANDTTSTTWQRGGSALLADLVEATADALLGVAMTGVVEEIGAAPKIQGGDVLYTVRVRMDNVDPLLRWGMTMEVTFTGKK